MSIYKTTFCQTSNLERIWLKLHEKRCFQFYIHFKRVLLKDQKCIFILFYIAFLNLFSF